MAEVHPNIALLKRLDPHDMAASRDLFAEDAVLHYFNPNLPQLQGDHVGPEGIRAFFQSLAELSGGRIVEVWDIVPGQPTEVHDAGR